jgi:GT2 family glycosyltransferase
VDDASDEELSRHLDPGIDLVHLRNTVRLGTARSRNIGARHGTGDLLVFVDAHVCFPAGWLDAVCREEALLAHGVLAPSTFNIVDHAQFRALALELKPPPLVRLMSVGGVFNRIAYGYYKTPLPAPRTLPNVTRKFAGAFTVPIVGGAALCVRRDVFFRLGGFEDELGGFGAYEDEELCMRCWAFGSWVAVLPSIRCFHFKARPSRAIEYRSRPFHSSYYDQSVENALRVLYLHLPEDVFRGILDVYKDNPGFAPDLNAVLTDRLERRKSFISANRIHDYRWLQRRMCRV